MTYKIGLQAARVIVLCTLALLPPGATYALDPEKSLTQYNVSVWSIEDGLPQNTVRAILQTRDGYLWFGTQEGLARFDGVSFKIFDMMTAPTMRSSYVGALLEDQPRWTEDFEFVAVALDSAFVGSVFRDSLSGEHTSFRELRGENDSVVTQFVSHFKAELQEQSYMGALHGESLGIKE